jgi:hypothetical protein
LAINKAGCLEELRALHSAQKYFQPSPPGAGRVEFFISHTLCARHIVKTLFIDTLAFGLVIEEEI